ncbi:hypothetical protein J3E72DRAFT_387817 [Bipolaris maydis]|nr:hypothetical protein J3E73DRAFT_425431 [Bipolaris maydis]KAJ6195163.1 hypothetical protein J3E72DRAFT_387817 [Bipolaris maydis]KAJ6278520.1 hypothetical protein J3E71DRAFT_401714 [Bipolaris maydis]
MTSHEHPPSSMLHNQVLNKDVDELMHLNPALNKDDARDVLRAHNYKKYWAAFYVAIGRICGRFPRIPYAVAEALLLAHNEDWEEVCEAFHLLLETMEIREHTDQATEVAAFVGGMPHLLHRCDLLANHFMMRQRMISNGYSPVTVDSDLLDDEDVNLWSIPKKIRFQVAKLQHRHARACRLGGDCNHRATDYYHAIDSTDSLREAEIRLNNLHDDDTNMSEENYDDGSMWIHGEGQH